MRVQEIFSPHFCWGFLKYFFFPVCNHELEAPGSIGEDLVTCAVYVIYKALFTVIHRADTTSGLVSRFRCHVTHTSSHIIVQSSFTTACLSGAHVRGTLSLLTSHDTWLL